MTGVQTCALPISPPATLTRALFAGKVGVFGHGRNRKLQLTHPQFEPLGAEEDERAFLAVYPATGGIRSWEIGRCVRQVLDVLDVGGRVEVTDPLPDRLRREQRLPELGQALRRIHLPETAEDHEAARRRDRKSTRLNSSHVSLSRMPSSA